MSEKMKIDATTEALVKRLSRFYSGVVHDIMDTLGIYGFFEGVDLKGVLPESGKICGPAATVQFRKTTSKRVQWEIHEAIDIAAGHVLVVDSDWKNGGRGSVFGGLMSTGAKVNGLLGTIVDGTVRDIEEVKKVGYPLYGRGIAPLTAVGRLVSTGINVTIECCGVTVSPGDVIFADYDGAVRVPRAALETVVTLGERLFNEENTYEADIKSGKPLLKVFASMDAWEENKTIKNALRP
jgi:4-hydroxy-4-methyl-2-oxoglutarate aldolase